METLDNNGTNKKPTEEGPTDEEELIDDDIEVKRALDEMVDYIVDESEDSANYEGLFGFPKHLPRYGGSHDDTKELLQFLAVCYTGIAIFAITVCSIASRIQQGTWNPIKGIQSANKYRSLYNEAEIRAAAITKPNNILDFDERVDLWNRMGYTQTFDKTKEDGTFRQFPHPTLENLERALQSYDREKK
ncbi:hypothetical protein J4206_02815 [Candidatus Woesearchaeota archaeon]|nr:hypothetical protein [Candidatus Woesearchaeota archaeon]